ncbi:mitochondrial intermembrane space import and assembly protein 40 homolog [Phoenix dactylifera]|uniref:Mitochondrial intermembrane space import and assembly protein 40 homolog n=1 Tax=Phoenix dactylifera TaxID=42345 RepID=A0A8B7CW16_PHODC|nr:mitochondrial intermembrane space import and assembly protein 40 homolog [Phoenix dactylifera]
MGQTQSDASSSEGDQTSQPATQPSPSPAPSFEDLVAEATALGSNENESLDMKAQRALECPCVAELRKGPCGTQFTEAFVCFIKSTAEEKGSDCVKPFIALQDCIKANPDAFSKDVLGEEESESGKGEEEVKDYKIIPPLWSRVPKSKN